VADLQRQLAEREAELAEAREHQAATAEVLQVKRPNGSTRRGISSPSLNSSGGAQRRQCDVKAASGACGRRDLAQESVRRWTITQHS
jgi:hypothetical protein